MRLTRNIIAPMNHIFQLVLSRLIRIYPKTRGKAISIVPAIMYDIAFNVVNFYLAYCVLSGFLTTLVRCGICL